MTLTFRDTLRKISPRWLQGYFGERLLYAIGVQLDALGDAAAEAVKLRFPGLAPSEALPLIGKDRRIIRGLDESDESYAGRLPRWLDDHALRGGPYGLFGQLGARYAQNPFVIDLVYVTGRSFRLNVDGSIGVSDIAWAPSDGDLEKWARWWLFYEWPGSITLDTWDSAETWDATTTWDSSLTAADIASLRLIPREWNAAHAKPSECHIVLLTDGGVTWDYPVVPWDSGETWDSGVVVDVLLGDPNA